MTATPVSPPTKQAIVGWLRQEWLKPTRLTSIPQALGAHGLAVTDPLRWDVTATVARRWRSMLTASRSQQWPDHPERLTDFQRQLKTWRFPAVALTTNERLVARAMLEDGAPVTINAASARTGLAMNDVRTAMDGLRRLGFLRVDGLNLVANVGERFLSGLGLSFHTVERPATGERFNTTCAIDYAVLARNTYPGERLTLSDACAHCLDRLHATYDGERVIDASPNEPVLYRGGPCAQNLLFTNADHLEDWLGGAPDPQKAAPLGEWLMRWGR